MDAPQAGPAGKLLAGLIVVAVLVAGVFFWGRVANDDRLAMLFTTLWFGAVLAGGYLATRARTELRVPMALGFGVVAVATTILVGLPMFQTDEVNERVVTGEPVSETSRDEQSEQVPDEEGERPPRNVELASGRFVGLAHPGSGVAAVVALAEGGRKLTLTKFATDNGPDLRVYLSTKNPAKSGELGEFKDVGALKGNAGDQQYDVPSNFDLDRFSNVVIWCRAFSVGFTSASLETS
jgi:hypothetical protein